MTPERIQQIQDLYHEVLECTPEQREAFLAQACDGDGELQREVESLLVQNGSDPGPLQRPAMSLLAEAVSSGVSVGDSLGPYRIEGILGAGGMGTVYKARDTRLGRVVAIKISNRRFSELFEREARVISSLNHPNICTLYDVGPNYLVMELVEGETLSERIRRGPIPLSEALRIAKQIAGALEAAHENGIVHRDLKPANIKIRPDGSVKVLDFGLAKEVSAAPAVTPDSPTVLSVPGVIMGTAGYMSPEQARGQKVDKRADIWAFGVVLYEMVSGKKLFERATVSDTVAAVIKEEPDLTGVPVRLQRVLGLCFEKDPNRRLRDISGVGLLLQAEPATPSKPRLVKTAWVAAAVGLTLAILSAGLAFRAISDARQAASGTFAHLTMGLAPAEMLGPAGFYNRPSRTAFAISPDGATVVFAGMSDRNFANGRNFMLYRRPLGEATAVAIAGTEGAEYPFFSPDGQWVGFASWVPSAKGSNHAADFTLKKVALRGGPPIEICALAGRIAGANWGSAGVIVFSTGGLWTVPESGGTPSKLLERGFAPAFLPDGKTVLFFDSSGHVEDAHVDSIQIATKQRKTLVTNAVDPRYSPTGHLLFMRNADLLAVPFDAAHTQVSGSPVPLISGIMQAINAPPSNEETGMGQFALSSSGTLLYAPGGINPPQSNALVLVDRKGTETTLATIQGQVSGLRVSPDGTLAAVGKTRDVSRETDLWAYEIPSGTPTRLTSTGNPSIPLFSPDGKSITYYASTGLYSMPLNGGGTPAHIGESDQISFASSWSADGKWLAYLKWLPYLGETFQLFVRPMQKPGESIHFGPSGFQVQSGEFSPDGRWIAYASDEGGTLDIYVQAFPGPGAKHRISSGGNTNPAWSRDGRELFYARVTTKTPAEYSLTMMAAEISGKDGSVVGASRTLFEGPYLVTFPSRSYDVMPDGRFLLVRNRTPPDQKVTQLNVVLGWGEELKRRVPKPTPAR
jgi:Tol biopolymer transport system component/predicted Ser/Thr protein kinase